MIRITFRSYCAIHFITRTLDEIIYLDGFDQLYIYNYRINNTLY